MCGDVIMRQNLMYGNSVAGVEGEGIHSVVVGMGVASGECVPRRVLKCGNVCRHFSVAICRGDPG